MSKLAMFLYFVLLVNTMWWPAIMGSGNTTMEVGADGVALITIHNPPNNFLNFQVMDSLKENFDEALRRDDVLAIVVTGGNQQFSGGFDVAVLGQMQDGTINGEPRRGYISIEIVTDTIEAGRKPCVAAIHGVARGGGLEIPMACHGRISTPTAQLGLPELSVGLIPGFGGTQRLPRLVGLDKSLEMMLTSELIPATEARKLGLVDAMVPVDELVDTARRWAIDIAARRRPMVLSLYKNDKVRPLHKAREIIKRARDNVGKQTPNLQYPTVCIDVVEEGIVRGPRAGLWKEANAFQELLNSETSRRLVRATLAQTVANSTIISR